MWAEDGRELFYQRGATTVVVPVQTGPDLRVGNEEVLFDGESFVSSARAYDLDNDGQRFLMVTTAYCSRLRGIDGAARHRTARTRLVRRL